MFRWTEYSMNGKYERMRVQNGGLESSETSTVPKIFLSITPILPHNTSMLREHPRTSPRVQLPRDICHTMYRDYKNISI